MEPLSIAGSIFGLLAAGAQLVPKCYNLASAFRDAAQDAEAAALELSDLAIVLKELQKYIDGTAQASTQRLHLISLEHVTATLTQCVKTYSQLHSVLKTLHIDKRFRAIDHAVWLLKRDEVAQLVARLQNHKNTFGLMLGILQCATLNEAESKMDRLCNMVNAVLLSNTELAMRLRDIENHFPPVYAGSRTAEHRLPAILAVEARIDSEKAADKPTKSNRSSIISLRSSNATPRPSVDRQASSARGRAFEDLLHRSRVYRHASKRLSLFSSDAKVSVARSLCSTLTLDEVSNISVCALPVYANEISNAQCYSFGLPTIPDLDEDDGDDEVQGIWWQVSKLKATPIPRRRYKIPNQLGIVTPPESLRSYSSASNRGVRKAHVVICISNSDGTSHIYGQLPLRIGDCQRFLDEKATDVKSRFTAAATFSSLRTLQEHFVSNWQLGKYIKWSGYTVRNVRILLSRYCSIYRNAYEPFSDRRPIASQGPSYRLLGSKLPRQSRHLLLHIIDILGEFAGHRDFAPPNFITSHHTGTETLPHNVSDMSDAMIFLIEGHDKFMVGVSSGED